MSVDWHLKDESPEEKAKGQMKTLFLMNPEPEPKKLLLEFAGTVRIHGMNAGASAETGGQSHGNCFETELPPLSVIPLSLLVEKTQKSLEEKEEDGAPAELA